MHGSSAFVERGSLCTNGERLVIDWGIESEAAIRGITWALGLVEEAIRTGNHP